MCAWGEGTGCRNAGILVHFEVYVGFSFFSSFQMYISDAQQN